MHWPSDTEAGKAASHRGAQPKIAQQRQQIQALPAAKQRAIR